MTHKVKKQNTQIQYKQVSGGMCARSIYAHPKHKQSLDFLYQLINAIKNRDTEYLTEFFKNPFRYS